MANVVEQGVKDYIIPLPNTSDNAFEMFSQVGLTADLVYIDAAHEYECVMRDIVNSWKSLRDGGILVLDDYLKWPGVTKAVDDFAASAGAKVYGEYMKAALGKGVDIGAVWVPALAR
jgi:predicted O-methyltransferase YrrM